MTIETDDRSSRLVTPACETGISIRTVANKSEIVGNGHWRNAELFTDTSFIPHLSRSTIKLYYTIVSHALRQVLVWGAVVNTRHSRRSAKRQRRAGNGGVGLSFHHRPDYNSH